MVPLPAVAFAVPTPHCRSESFLGRRSLGVTVAPTTPRGRPSPHGRRSPIRAEAADAGVSTGEQTVAAPAVPPPPVVGVATAATAAAAANDVPPAGALPRRERWPYDAARPGGLPFDMPSFLAAYFTSATTEYASVPLQVVTGTLPTGLVGTLLRNGPGKAYVDPTNVAPGDKPILPFDGDGMVQKFVFPGDGRVLYTNAFVRTDGYEAERAAGRVLYRGVFGTQKPPGLRLPTPWGPVDTANAGDLSVKPIANTNVVAHAGKVLALWENAAPVAVDGGSLATVGPDSLGGLLSTRAGATVATTGVAALDRLTNMGADALCAHPRPAPVAGGGGARRMMAFGVKPVIGGGGTAYPWEPIRGGDVGAAHGAGAAAAAGAAPSTRAPTSAVREPPPTRGRRPTPPTTGVTTVDTTGGFTLIHDALATEQYYVLIAPPLELDVSPYLRGVATAAQALTLAPPPTPVAAYVVPRPDSAAATAGVRTTVRYLAHGFSFHHANAYEEGGELVIDSFVTSDFMGSRLASTDFDALDFNAMPPTVLTRFRVPAPRVPGAATRAVPPTTPGISRANPAPGVALIPPSRSGDFPTIHPAVAGRPYRYVFHAVAHVWAADGAPGRPYPLGGIARTDVSAGGTPVEWWAGPTTIVGEPLFVPRDVARSAYAVPPRPAGVDADGAEGDGWVLSLCYDGDRGATVLHILDADDVGGGPVCTLQLPAAVPMSIHGTFTPDVLL
ncbi:hypothetical protein BU14_0087s0012 [Porphyra umbilicalis]|uniref:Carotenoid oxygenase n=1 Tax=Porphyra umbilicalis TaxID=2786 RepID=A0A1X6PDX3_PORUM|nr:hypothetical protein BU14_0087s0012 [Porphyra umbilicalis]|eukprot:OSX79062.1 hypothetical protein BU14_0087s0012 [Porphyra umbilicalis]